MLEIDCEELDWQLSSLAQVCSSVPLISALEELEVFEIGLLSSFYAMEETRRWLELLDTFTALKNLYLTDEIAQRVCKPFKSFPAKWQLKCYPRYATFS